MAQNTALKRPIPELPQPPSKKAASKPTLKSPHSSLLSLGMIFVSLTLIGLMGMLYISAWAMVKREGNRKVDLAKQENSFKVRLQEVKSEFDQKISANEIDKKAKEHGMVSANETSTIVIK